MATISTRRYLLDQAKRRFTPTPNTLPGMGTLDKRLRAKQWDQFVLAEPPAGSGLKPILGDSGLPIIGHMIEIFRGGPDFILVRTPPRRCSPTATRTSRNAPGIR